MNSKQTLVVFGTAALCGLALAQTPTPTPPPGARLDALEKEVKSLNARLDALPAPMNNDVAALKKELGETRVLVNQLVSWAANQADGAVELARILDDSEQKGFTFGINPDSRVVLLGGWRSYLAGVQKDAPKPVPTVIVKDSKGVKIVSPPPAGQ
ncbi:MAG TPA: hypothetical protein VK843_03670 [Planctomycetota bacterium]|nr:hypothetical protein [Planctomycetota bacterium]